MMQLTQWFDWYHHPIRLGVYQRQYQDYSIEYCYWDGKCWHADEFPDKKWKSVFQCLPWRGIAQ